MDFEARVYPIIHRSVPVTLLLKPGAMKFKKLSDSESNLITEDDMTVIGDTNPKSDRRFRTFRQLEESGLHGILQLHV